MLVGFRVQIFLEKCVAVILPGRLEEVPGCHAEQPTQSHAGLKAATLYNLLSRPVTMEHCDHNYNKQLSSQVDQYIQTFYSHNMFLKHFIMEVACKFQSILKVSLHNIKCVLSVNASKAVILASAWDATLYK